MKMRNTLSALLMGVGLTAVGIAQADVYVYDTTVTPPRVIDVTPPHVYGYATGQGYAWDGTRYVWMGQRPDPANDAYDRWSWVPDDFVQTPNAFLRPDNKGN